MTRRRSRSVRTSFVTVLLTVGASVAGCGNDFDALFADQRAAGPTEAGTTPDSGAPTGDASSTADGPRACEAPTACSPAVACLGKACTNTCNGCDCSCPPFDCDGDVDTCITTCAAGTTCSVTCKAEKDCALTARARAVAKLTCDGEMDRCSMTCEGGASCELTCDLDRGGNRCIAICDATSSCLVDCGDSGPCDVNCQGGQKQTCAKAGLFTCNRDCPT